MTKENTAFNEDQQVILRVMNTLNSPRRWTKDREQTGFNRFCLLGAFKHVLGLPIHRSDDDPNGSRAMAAVYKNDAWRVLSRMLVQRGKPYTSPMQFNDDFSTTHRDVMDALAAALLKAGDTTKGTK